MALSSTQEFELNGPGGGSAAPGGRLDSTRTSEPFGGPPSPNAGVGASSRSESVGPVTKGETPGIINSTIYSDVKGSPSSLETTLEDVLQISFNK